MKAARVVLQPCVHALPRTIVKTLSSALSLIMQTHHRPVGCPHRFPVCLTLSVCLLIGTLIATARSSASDEGAQNVQSLVDAIAARTGESPMVKVPEGTFLMGTARNSEGSFSLALQYDDTEQPQRLVWLDPFEIDRDEVSLGAYLQWLRRSQRAPSDELLTLIRHVMTVHALSPDTLAHWPAIYVTWAEATGLCRARGARLPTEAEWEKAARGENGNLFPWGQSPPTTTLAMFGHYHVHEIPIVAPVDSGEEGRSPYGLHHMAGNAAEWVEDWFGIDYYATMPDRNPSGPASGRYKVVRGGSWKSAPALLRTATRSGALSDQRTATVGFRCARSL